MTTVTDNPRGHMTGMPTCASHHVDPLKGPVGGSRKGLTTYSYKKTMFFFYWSFTLPPMYVIHWPQQGVLHKLHNAFFFKYCTVNEGSFQCKLERDMKKQQYFYMLERDAFNPFAAINVSHVLEAAGGFTHTPGCYSSRDCL